MQTLLPEDPRIFGRDHVFERLLQRTEGLLAGYRQNMALIGPEGTGKSSTLERIQEVIRCEDLIVIRIGTAPEEFRSFAERFIARLFFQALLKKGMRARDINGTLLSRSGKFFPRTQQSARDIVRLARRDPTTAFGRLFELPGLRCSPRLFQKKVPDPNPVHTRQGRLKGLVPGPGAPTLRSQVPDEVSITDHRQPQNRGMLSHHG